MSRLTDDEGIGPDVPDEPVPEPKSEDDPSTGHEPTTEDGEA